MMEVYRRVCKRCGLVFTEVDADNGQIGGSESCEFMALAESGEAEIAYCGCGYAADTEMLDGDLTCPKCGKLCKTDRGIEVGQVFKLGTKYSESMGVYYTGEDGKQHPFVMGCYGIGVTRMMAAAIEQWNDENGVMWDPKIAPAHVVVIPLADSEVTDKIVFDLESRGIEVCIDDRNERAGFKFKDADLIGWPYQITIGKRSLENGCVEFKDRRKPEKQEIKIDKIVDVVSDEVQSHLI